MTDHVKVTQADGVQTITLARPDKKNALSNVMYGRLADAILAANSDSATRILVIRGEGDMFTAGNDVGEFAATSRGENTNEERHVVRFLHALAQSSRPVVAAVNGRAVGVGTTMLLHCDFVLLGEDALLSTPFVNLGLVPEAGSTLQLTARVGHLRAYEMFALGEPVNATQALAWGLANRVVAKADLHAEADRIARVLAAKPLGSLMATKRLMRNTQAVLAQMQAESTEFVIRLQSPEAKEAFAALMERRAPDFSKFGG
jgi:enoyl-CoA hydratase/carnithine racemase